MLHQGGPGNLAAAFAVCEQMRARSLVDVLQGGRVLIHKGMTDVERQEEQRLDERLAELTARVAAARSGPKPDLQAMKTLLQELDTARSASDAFRRRVFLAHPELQTQRAGFAPAALIDLNRTLFARHPDLAILSYVYGERLLLLFVLTRGQDPAGAASLAIHRVEVEGRELEEAVETFRRACSQPGFLPDSEQLYDWLLAPAAEVLTGKTHLVIVPDDVLHTLPFQALQGPDGKYLLESCSVSYAPSVTALVKMSELAEQRRRGQTPVDLLAVGRPAFAKEWKDLPASEAEAQAIAALYPNKADLLLGRHADRTAVLAALGRARYVHLATHGLINETAPLYSAVALASRSERDDGRLYARELLDLDLQAELVVLSACETALGKQVHGEGILGLTWALFVAGTPSSVVTQWQVADTTTGTLMVEFYRRLAQGSAKAEALRQAQLVLVKDKKTRHPFYWAPFVLVGDWSK
jgi:CHAT domain-containing protein